MKKILLICLALLGSSAVYAQQEDQDLQQAQELWGTEKKIVVKNFLALEGDKAASFWTIYDVYEKERKAIGKERYALIVDYVSKYAEIDDAKAAEMMARSFELRKQFLALLEKNFKAISKSHGGKVAAQFVQLETHFANSVETTVTGMLPFLGEKDGMD